MDLIRKIVLEQEKQERWEREQTAFQKRLKEFKERENEI